MFVVASAGEHVDEGVEVRVRGLPEEDDHGEDHGRDHRDHDGVLDRRRPALGRGGSARFRFHETTVRTAATPRILTIEEFDK